MKGPALLLLLTSVLLGDVEMRGSIALDAQLFGNTEPYQHKNALTMVEKFESTYSVGALRLQGRFHAQQDYYDAAGNKPTERSFARVDEAYGAYDFDDATVTLGRIVRFWGALEARNIVDGFNVSDGRNDPFTTDKLGAWQASAAYYTETGAVTLMVKFYEEEQPMAALPYVYYFFPENVVYEEETVTECSEYLPTYYLSWTGSTDTDNTLDYALILQHGYDAQRYYKLTAVSPEPTLQSHAYRVNKVMSYNTLVVGSTLYKLEAAYADVIDEALISDYLHGAVGVEHTFEQFYGGADLGIITEYYRYHRFKNTPYSDLELFESFQDDLFFGVRVGFNDVNDASLLAGVVADAEYAEQMVYAEFNSRIGDALRISADLRYINPSENEQTPYALLGRHQRVGIALGYYF